MLRRLLWLLWCSACFVPAPLAYADITEVLNTPQIGAPGQAGLATAVFHGVAAIDISSTATIHSATQGLSILPYYAFQDVNINNRLASNNEFYYYPDPSYTTASFFRSDGAGAVLTDTVLWDNSGVDFAGYINFPVTGAYTLHIVNADDALAIFINGDGTPGSGDYVAVQNYYGEYSGVGGISDTCNITVNTAGWYPFEMANFQGGGGANMDVQITGPATVSFGSDFNHWTAFVPAIPLAVTPVANYSGPGGLAAAVWHNVPAIDGGLADLNAFITYANSTSPNYVFLNSAADTNFFSYQALNYYLPGGAPNTVSGFVINGAQGLAIDDAASLDHTMIDFVGWMHVPVTGTYYVLLAADDSATIQIGGTGPVGSGTPYLATDFRGVSSTYNPLISVIQAGWYPFELLYDQGNGGLELLLTYSGPGNIHFAADANRWVGSVSGFNPTQSVTATTSSWISGFAASLYHLANNYATSATLDATMLPVLQNTIRTSTPSYNFFTAPLGDPNMLYYRGNETQATSAILGTYAQGSAAADATAIGSTIIDHQGWVYFASAGYQWIFFDAATDYGAIYLGGNGTPGTGDVLLSGSFNDAPGVGAWGRVNITTPGWYPIEVLWFSRYDCGAGCNANLIMSAWGPGNISFAAAPVIDSTPPAPSGLLASVYRLAKPLPIGTNGYSIARALAQVSALQPNYTFLDPTGATTFALSGTDSTPLNTFLGPHASGLATADGNALGATIIDFRGSMSFAQAGNYTIALTAADDAAILMLGQEPNVPSSGQIVLERNFSGSVTSVASISSPLTLQVTAPTTHAFELVYYNSGDPASTHNAALGMTVTGPSPVTFAAPLNATAGVSVCGDFNAYIPYTTGTVDVLDYGATPNDGIDDYAAIQAALGTLGNGETLLFHPGNYNIVYSDLGTIATIDHMTNIDINGNGATLVVSGYNIDAPAAAQAFFKITNSHHVTVHDFSIDMSRPPFSHGAVVAAPAANKLRVSFDAAYAVDAGIFIDAFTEYDVNNLPLAQGLDDYYLGNPAEYSVSQDSPQILTITMNLRTTPGAQVGEYAVVRHAYREQPAILALNSNYVSVGNMNIYAAPGDGVQTNMVNTLYVQNLNIRNAAGRYMSVTGHGIEAHGSTGGVTVCGSTLEGMGGDGIQTTGQPGTITAVAGSKITVATDGSFGVAPFRVGDEIRVWSPDGAIRGGAIATAASTISDASASNVLAFKYAPYGTAVGDTVVAYNRDTNIHIYYSAVAHNSGRGIALANGGVIIDHTQIQGTTGYGVQCYTDLSTVAPACDRVLLSNNNFHAVGNSNNLASASFSTYCNNALCPNQLTKNIILTNNAFDNTAGRAVEFASVYSFDMYNNALNKIATTLPMSSISAVDINSGTLGSITGNSIQNSSTLAVSQTGVTKLTNANNTGTW